MTKRSFLKRFFVGSVAAPVVPEIIKSVDLFQEKPIKEPSRPAELQAYSGYYSWNPRAYRETGVYYD